MGKITINPAVAKEQATKLSNAADGLLTNVSISFSNNTTISGNEQAKESARAMKKYTDTVNQALLRDVGNIQSVAADFVRADETIADQLRNNFDLSGLGKK